MPVRSEKPVQQEVMKIPYEYEELLVHLRKHIDETYGGVANFLQTKDFEKVNLFHGTDEDKAKMFTYLSLPAEGQKSKVKSFPVISKLYKELLGITLENKIEVVRRQLIVSDTKLKK